MGLIVLLIFSCGLATAAEFTFPTGKDYGVSGSITVQDNGRFSVGASLQKSKSSRTYAIYIYDSSNCSQLQSRMTLYVKNSQGEVHAFNANNSHLAKGSKVGGLSAMGFVSVAAHDEHLITPITGKAITFEDDTGKVLECWLYP